MTSRAFHTSSTGIPAIGEPGSRTFYLQARAGAQRVSVKCEKQQVRAIAQYLRRVLSDLPPPEDRPLPSAADIRDPGEQSFVLGPIGLGYDRGNDRLLVQLEELIVGDDEDDELDTPPTDRGHIRLYVTRSQAAYTLALQKDDDTLAPQAMTKTLFESIVRHWPADPGDTNGKARPALYR